jgi:hypothetical protein
MVVDDQPPPSGMVVLEKSFGPVVVDQPLPSGIVVYVPSGSVVEYQPLQGGGIRLSKRRS